MSFWKKLFGRKKPNFDYCAKCSKQLIKAPDVPNGPAYFRDGMEKIVEPNEPVFCSNCNKYFCLECSNNCDDRVGVARIFDGRMCPVCKKGGCD